ncbi:MAG: hypothetical protein AAFQ36_10255 [Pseudomonadota bacterium]
MVYDSLTSLLSEDAGLSGKLPLGLIFVEDDSEIASTIEHHRALGFANLAVVGDVTGLEDVAEQYQTPMLRRSIRTRVDLLEVLNAVIEASPGRWIFWCYNAEYFFFPYSESRRISDLTDFMTEERREHVFTYALDLYARDLYRHPNAVSCDDAHFDSSGYYSFQRFADGEALDRQFDIFGGLSWRYEEFVPWERRRIDRISLFRAKPGLLVNENLTLSEPEMNTVACQWHHNVTVAIASFRVAKSLKRNPGSTFEIESMMWRRSERFEWRSQQLLEMGFIEPGQWF